MSSVLVKRNNLSITYKFKGLEDELGLGKNIMKRLNDVYKREIEPGGNLNSYKTKGGRARLNQILKNTGGRHTKKRRQELISAYQLAWKRAYQRNVKTAKSVGIGSDPDYQRRKRRWKQRGRRVWGRRVKYETPLLLTGHLRKSIATGFADGGNKYLRLPNMLLFGAYRVDFRYFDKPWNYDSSNFTYVERLMQFLEGKGMDPEEFFDFEPEMWSLIASKMMKIIQKDFIPKMQQEF